MIFVTTGTCEPFDRLLEAVNRLPHDERLVVQTGLSSVRPERAECVEFLPYDDLVSFVREARVVVTHAGVGSILTCLANRKKPVVVPRLRRHGDAVDDHQLELARRLSDEDLVVLVRDLESLPALVAEVDAADVPAVRPGRALVAELCAYVDAHTG